MTIKSIRRKQQSFYPPMVKEYPQNNCLYQPPLSHCGTSSRRTRTVTRKSVGGYSSCVIVLKMSLFMLVFVLSNFHASLGRQHSPSGHPHHNLHHSHRHNRGGGEFRTCSHEPPKPEEVSYKTIQTHIVSLYGGYQLN